MEGNPSTLKDIEAALKQQLSPNSSHRNFQLEHLAHIETQKEMQTRLIAEPNLNVCSKEFLCWLHKQFYSKLPADLRFAKTRSEKILPVIPGALRDQGVQVGNHHAPETQKEIEDYLGQFAAQLDPSKVMPSQRPIALAASHHRLLWIHPFADGNGRVARLFTAAYTQQINLSANHLWAVSRAFARDRADYDAHLAKADRLKRTDYDGRGPLSEEDLIDWIRYFLKSCLDQLTFMGKMIERGSMESRLKTFLAIQTKEKNLSKSAAKALTHLFKEGEIRRGDVKDICNVQDRQSNKIVKEILTFGLATSGGPKKSLKAQFTHELATVLFPNLT